MGKFSDSGTIQGEIRGKSGGIQGKIRGRSVKSTRRNVEKFLDSGEILGKFRDKSGEIQGKSGKIQGKNVAKSIRDDVGELIQYGTRDMGR